MVMELVFLLLVLICAILLVTGKPLSINITHVHKVEGREKEEPVTAHQEQEPDKDSKELSELLQGFWGVLNEDQ